MTESRYRPRPSALTRRAILAGAVASPLIPPTALPQDSSDPVLALWRKWQEANAQAEAWRSKWQTQETWLFRTVGFPNVTVPAPNEANSVRVVDHDQIDELLGDGAETAAMRERLHAELAAHKERWAAAAASVRFDAVESRYDAADADAAALSEAIFATPAGSLAGIAAKLALVIAMGQASEHDDQFPWPQLRGVLSDSCRLAVAR